MNDDDALRDRLKSLAGPPPAARALLDELRPTMVRRKRRRRTALATSAAGALLTIGASAWALTGGGERAAFVETANQPSVPIDDVKVPTSAATASTATTAPTTTAISTTRVAAPSTVPAATAPNGSPATTERTTSTSRPPASGPSTVTGPATSTAASTLLRYPTRGGLVEVRWASGGLTIERVEPAPGYEHEIKKADPSDVEVEFARDEPDDQVKVRVRLIDGRPVEEIS